MGPLVDGREKTLLRRWGFCEAELDDSEPGAKLCRPALAPWNILLDTDRRTDERPASAPSGPPYEAREKFGCDGRLAEFNRELRMCPDVNGALLKPMELVRFRADAGWGIEE